MFVDIVYLILSLGLIFLAAELFTNAIEWFGKHMKLNEGTVGSVLAAVGTALPETSVAIVAIFLGGKENTDAGIGAILGAPMMLSTLAMFITGLSVLIFASAGKRSKVIHADYAVVGRDLRSFFLVYSLALVGAAIPIKAGKIAVALVLIGIYVAYVHRTLKCPECESHAHGMRPLHFHRAAASPHLRLVIVQLAAGLALMIVGAKIFVENVTLVSKMVGIGAGVLSLIITPIATELPEKFNSITWMRHKKDTLALGNITGAMVFQSSVLPAIGMLFTPWKLEPAAAASIVVAMLGSFIIWGEMTIRKRLSPYSLLIGGVMYLLYPVIVFLILPAMGY